MQTAETVIDAMDESPVAVVEPIARSITQHEVTVDRDLTAAPDAVCFDKIEIIGDRIKALMDQGKSLDQIKAARPTLDYDGVYGSPKSTCSRR